MTNENSSRDRKQQIDAADEPDGPTVGLHLYVRLTYSLHFWIWDVIVRMDIILPKNPFMAGKQRSHPSPLSSDISSTVNWDQLFLSPFVGEWNRFISFPRRIWDIQFLSICERTYCQRSYPNSNAVAHALFFMDIRDLLLAYRPKNNRPRCIFNFCGRICLGVCQIPIKIEKIIINSQLSRAKKTPDPAEICP